MLTVKALVVLISGGEGWGTTTGRGTQGEVVREREGGGDVVEIQSSGSHSSRSPRVSSKQVGA